MSPDGKQIAIVGERVIGLITDTDRHDIEQGIWIYDIQSDELRPLLTGDKLKCIGPAAWSPDNRWLAICEWKGNYTPQQIVLVDTQTEETRQIAEGREPVFSPDGTKLAYCEHTVAPGFVGNGSVCVIDTAGNGRASWLTPAGVRCKHPTWSPDGSQIAFVTEDRRGHSYVVHTAEVDGSRMQDIYAAKGHTPGRMSWGRDGAALYLRTPRTILKISADGSGLVADLGGNEDDSMPPDDVWQQLVQARSVIADSLLGYHTGVVRICQGRLDEARYNLRKATLDLYAIPWNYPLARVSMPDLMAYADAANELARAPDATLLSVACRVRMMCNRMDLSLICRGRTKLPPDIQTLRKNAIFVTGSLQVPDSRWDSLMCPGKNQSKPVPYIYHAPKNGEPKIGDVILQCSNHPEHRIAWDASLEYCRHLPPLKPAGKK
ncbi:MAG: hypothetical protein A2Z18_00025 [Armatimonadetes bacterium RBG_16_58_9]|nr:MAG: hypothetical protein A2Z18_00025 [Armatimonadetes bacterium RBG_16_58_9]